jgi:hypothetical protein
VIPTYLPSTYRRSQQIKRLKAAKAELKRSRRSKPYFDFLGDCRKDKAEGQAYCIVLHIRPCSPCSSHYSNYHQFRLLPTSGDSVSVRYYLRLVVQDSDGECKWNTEEIVLFRTKPPRSCSILSAIEGSAEYDSTAV